MGNSVLQVDCLLKKQGRATEEPFALNIFHKENPHRRDAACPVSLLNQKSAQKSLENGFFTCASKESFSGKPRSPVIHKVLFNSTTLPIWRFPPIKSFLNTREKWRNVSAKEKETPSRERRWSSLIHNGVIFPQKYAFKGFPIKIRGAPFKATPLQEEMLFAIARKIGTPYLEDPVFIENFMSDFSKTLPRELMEVKFGEIDLSAIRKFQEEEKAAKERLTKEEKKALLNARKAEREKLKEKFGYAIVDGKKVERAGYVVEPAGLFMGRGAHPNRGKWKAQAKAEEITLNLSKDAPVPEGNWRKIVSDPKSTWLASWTDQLSGKVKYMWLSDLSEIRQQNDIKKYDKAKILSSKIDKVRNEISRCLSLKSEEKKKLAVVAYLIDRLAMRVGDEKDKDEADTVGATTLRAEHVKVSGEKIFFDFLGKDSVRWQKEIVCGTDDDRKVLKYLGEAIRKKKPEDPLFPEITSSKVNNFLSSCAKGLSAKVFRTYHATKKVEEFLANSQITKEAPDYEKVYWGKLANLEAARVCNHKRTPPKGWEDSLRKKEEKLALLEKELSENSQKKAVSERVGRAKRELELAVKVRDYNMNTSLRNYIDPRVYAMWSKRVGIDVRKIYPASLQKKFSWIPEIRPAEKKKKGKPGTISFS